MEKYWYDFIFDADKRNNIKIFKEFAEKMTIEDILKFQHRTDTLFMMNTNEVSRNINKPNLNFLFQ